MENLGQTKVFLLDMDGTINLGQRLLPGAKEFIDYLKLSGRRFLFLTNNSSQDGRHYVQKMCKLGISCDADNMWTAGDATINYLIEQKAGARIYLLGTAVLEEDFRQHDFVLTDENPDFVVLGFDQTLTYEKLVKACDFIHAGVTYIATHPDINCPVENGYIPDVGAMMALIEASTGKRPQVIGKPKKEIIESAFRKLGVYNRDETAIVGDRVYTDIQTGANAGILSVLVLSGESTVADLEKYGVKADFVFDGVGDILQQLQSYDKKQK